MMALALPFTRPPLPFLLEPIVRRALEEDLGQGGDITSDLTIPADKMAKARIVARQAGNVSGFVAAACAFRLINPETRLSIHAPDGSAVEANTVLAEVEGTARALLSAERVALNFLGHLSGIATATRALVDAVAGMNAQIVCTRKMTPGLRLLEKYAVRCGGGFNHRYSADSAVLVKDNHIAICGGIKPAMERARVGLAHMMKIEVEVDTLAQLEEALALGVDTILLDNMSIADLTRAVSLAKDRAVLEASGNITRETARAVAETGVDYISSGAITHSAPTLDIGLDF